MTIKEFFLKFLTGTVEKEGEQLLEEELQKVHDTDPVDYDAAIYGLNAGVLALSKVNVFKTGIGAEFVKALGEAVAASALANGITLPTTATASIAAAKAPAV